MVLKTLKVGAIALGGALLLGGLIFGSDLLSYARSGTKTVRRAVKEKVPIEFELQRARDLVEEIIPELQANIKLIAQEEVEIAALKKDIARSKHMMHDETKRIGKLRNHLEIQRASYQFNDRDYSRQQVKQELARRFERFKESEMMLEGKKRLLAAREKSLRAAVDMLDKTRGEKAKLEHQIEGLTAQYRLVKASSAGARINVDDSKLAQSGKLIKEIKKRLDVAERVLAHEAQFVPEIPVDIVDEKDLLEEVDEYFGGGSGKPTRAVQKDDIITLESKGGNGNDLLTER